MQRQPRVLRDAAAVAALTQVERLNLLGREHQVVRHAAQHPLQLLDPLSERLELLALARRQWQWRETLLRGGLLVLLGLSEGCPGRLVDCGARQLPVEKEDAVDDEGGAQEACQRHE